MATSPAPCPDLAVARLCGSCQRASFDDTTCPVDIWQARLLLYGDKPSSFTEYSFIDELPELAGLDASAAAGCDSCRFLRAIILSGDTNDVLVHDLGRGFAELGQRQIEIDISYRWMAKERAGSHVGLMKILLEIESVATKIELQCFIEAAEGTGILLGCRQPDCTSSNSASSCSRIRGRGRMAQTLGSVEPELYGERLHPLDTRSYQRVL